MAQNTNHKPQQQFIEPELVETQSRTLRKYLTWSSASVAKHRSAEKKILSYLKTPCRGWYVDLGSCVGQEDKIWTLSFNNDSKATPLLLVHGFGMGAALWVMNIDELAKNRTVYAIDMLGFGRSARPKFAKDALEAEKQFVKSIEEWRCKMNLDKMIVLGHSMGGYLAASYAIEYPDRVKHLIMADAWGIPEPPTKNDKTQVTPLWFRVGLFVMRPMNPLCGIRVAGPWGKWVSREHIRLIFSRAFKCMP
jgi:abhydrolase domain-containing protein 4